MSEIETSAAAETAPASEPIVRSFGTDLWSVVDLGKAFSEGFYIFGSAPALFRLSVTAACIDVLSQDVSRTPIHLRKRTSTGSVVVQPNEHPAAALLARPSRFYGRRAFMRQVVTNLVMNSEHFLVVDRARAGKLREIQSVPKKAVSRRVNVEARRRFYDITASSLDDQMLFGWATRGFMSDDNVAHLISRTVNGYDAISTSSISGATLGLLRQMQEYQTGIFNNGGLPVMAFKFPKELTDPQFERLKNDFARSIKRAKESGTPFILEGADGAVPDVEKLSLSSVDTDFVKANAAAGLEAARFFRVPPHKIFLLESVKYDNQAEQERIYVDDGLGPIFDVLEEGFDHVLLDEDERADYFTAFERELAYSMKPEERQKIVESRWKNGMISRDEMRRQIGENTIGGDAGDVWLISGNFVLIDKDNEVIMRAGGNTPDANNASDPQANAGGKAKETAPLLRIVKE